MDMFLISVIFIIFRYYLIRIGKGFPTHRREGQMGLWAKFKKCPASYLV